jgi:hypothetical protein
MILNTLRDALIANGITAAIYLDFLPAEPDTALLLRGYAGRPPDVGHKYDSPGLQVVSRSNDYETARQNAYNVFYTLHGTSAYGTVSGLQNVIDIIANQSPYFIGRDDRDRSTFTQNFSMQIVRN